MRGNAYVCRWALRKGGSRRPQAPSPQRANANSGIYKGFSALQIEDRRSCPEFSGMSPGERDELSAGIRTRGATNNPERVALEPLRHKGCGAPRPGSVGNKGIQRRATLDPFNSNRSGSGHWSATTVSNIWASVIASSRDSRAVMTPTWSASTVRLGAPHLHVSTVTAWPSAFMNVPMNGSGAGRASAGCCRTRTGWWSP